MSNFKVGDRVFLVGDWDDMDYDLEDFIGNGTSYRIFEVDDETEEVRLEFDFYNEDDDETYYDMYWVPQSCIRKKVVINFTLTDADKKYADVVMKIRHMQQTRKENGYAF